MSEYKKEGSDWFALFNPRTKRVLDVSLVHTLMHERFVFFRLRPPLPWLNFFPSYSVVCCVRFSADGKFLATGCNRTAQIYDTKTGAKTWFVAWLSFGRLFADGAFAVCLLMNLQARRAICIFVVCALAQMASISPRVRRINRYGYVLIHSSTTRFLLILPLQIWDIAKKRIRTVFDGHQQEIYSLDFSADGRLIVSGSGDKTARIWDMVDGTSKVLTINDPDSLNNDAGVTSVAISPNGQLVAAGSLDTVVRIWDVATAQLVERLRGHRDSVYSVAFTPDGKGLVSGSLDKTLKYWDVSGLMSGGVKGRKEGQVAAAAAQGGVVVANGGSGSGVRKDGDKGSQCTMNFTGHKVRFIFFFGSGSGADCL